VHEGLRLLTPQVARFERRAMGSPLRLTLVGIEGDGAATGWAAVSSAIEEIEQTLSRFRPTSDLVALNDRAGDPACRVVHPRLYEAVAATGRAWRLTDGAFDPRVLADLERLGYPGAAGAAGPIVDSGRDRTFPDGRWLRRDPRRRALAVAAPVDLGGIGKGLALRWAFATLAGALPELGDGETGALLEAGGDLVARGAAPQEGPWLVAIEDPRIREEVAVVALDRGAVCTSSVGVHAWQTADGRSVHHLLDPATGEPGGDGLVSVTVAADDPAWAEVWSKTLFLEGWHRIGPRARALGLAAWWIGADGVLEMTPAARVRTAWLAAEA
jgi:thiamine biosynthesis lipoprotein